MAPLVLDVSLLRFTLLKKKFIFENETFFIRDKYCPLTVCLHLMEPYLTDFKALLSIKLSYKFNW